jgi:hypothetical protein
MSRPEHIAPPEEVRRARDLRCARAFLCCGLRCPVPHASSPQAHNPHPLRSLAFSPHRCSYAGQANPMNLTRVRGRLCVRQFYNREEAAKYATNSRMREIQTSLTERALELLALPSEDCLVLDVGCGNDFI